MEALDNLKKIEHIVVLVMENRSFDNVLGYLYPDNPDFNGVNDKMCNPLPDNKGSVCVRKGTDMTAPFPDPHEEYQFVYQQLFNKSSKMPVPNTAEEPPMQGFVIDYASAIKAANKKAEKKHEPPFTTSPDVIMNCFAPSSLPVINRLAESFAVCDNWFCSVPTQTFPNRSFVHAATSSGNVYNSWKDWLGLPGVFLNDTQTIYNKLEGIASWKIYHGGPLWLCNALYGQKKLWKYLLPLEPKRFYPLQSGDYLSHPDSQANQFCADVEAGELADYTFIEPNMMCSTKYGPENDMHPAFAAVDTGKPTNVLYGDKLIGEVYNALRSNEEIWNKTLLIITFDEHGGCYDHVAPPTSESSPMVVPPDNKPPKPYKKHTGRSGFDFKRLGVRVPAVLVSPWIEKGTICNTQFDHTSIIKTASNKWLRGKNLTNRDKVANDLSEILSLSKPRTDKIEITPQTPPPFDGCKEKSVSPFQSDITLASLHMLHEVKKLKTGAKGSVAKDEAMEKSDSTPEDLIARLLDELDTTEKVMDKLGSMAEDLLDS
jgi:phospholipase C